MTIIIKTKYKIYIASAVVVVIAIVTFAAISRIQISRLESAVETAKRAAAIKETEALEQEKRAVEYKAKIDYLEGRIGENQMKVRRKDEEIKMANTNTSRARVRVERARGTRTIDAGETELCTKLAGLGHPCE